MREVCALSLLAGIVVAGADALLDAQDALAREPSWWVLVTHIFSWRQPAVSALFSFTLCLVVLYAELWHLPLLLFAAGFLLSRFSSAVRDAQRSVAASPWHQDPPPPPPPKKGAKPLVVQALRGKKFLLKAQRDSGRLAAFVERLRNALNCSDPNVSFLLAVAAAALSAGFSLLLFLVHHFMPPIPLRVVLAGSIGYVLLPPSLHAYFLKNHLLAFGWLYEDIGLAVTLSLSRSHDDDDDTIDEDGNVSVATTIQGEEALGTVGRCVLALAKLCSSVPDELEMTHRTIAQQQVLSLAAEAVPEEATPGATRQGRLHSESEIRSEMGDNDFAWALASQSVAGSVAGSVYGDGDGDEAGSMAGGSRPGAPTAVRRSVTWSVGFSAANE